jgi:hypothetical protein
MKSSLQDTAASLAQSAADVFRVRAEAKRLKFVGVAQSHIRTRASKLADTIEKKLEDAIDIVSGGSDAHPLIEAAIQSFLSAAVEGMLQNRSGHRG